MADASEVRARQTLTELSQSRSALAQWVLPIVLVVLAILCIGLTALGQRFSSRSQTATIDGNLKAPRLVGIQFGNSSPLTFISVQMGTGEHDDLFMYATTPTDTLQNLTNSPSVTELWPVWDDSGRRIAYYGMTDSQANVYVQDLPDGAPLPITLQAGLSGLYISYVVTATVAPTFSPDGLWVAFPAKSLNSDAVELAVAKSDGKQVLDVTTLGHQVLDYVWIDNATLVVAARSPEGTLKKWLARIEPPSIRVEDFDSP